MPPSADCLLAAVAAATTAAAAAVAVGPWEKKTGLLFEFRPLLLQLIQSVSRSHDARVHCDRASLKRKKNKKIKLRR